MFEVANLEESDIVFKSAKVGVCDVWDHDDVEVTEAVVIDSVYIVASSHLTENVALEVPPTAAYKEAIGEACHTILARVMAAQYSLRILWVPIYF